MAFIGLEFTASIKCLFRSVETIFPYIVALFYRYVAIGIGGGTYFLLGIREGSSGTFTFPNWAL